MSPPLIIPFFIPHQGCPHLCVFCNQRLISRQTSYGESLREESGRLAETIHTYLKYKKNRTRVELAFFGGNFLGLERPRMVALLESVQPWIEQGLIHSIRCSTRPDTISREILKLVKPFGLATVELGVQSMDDQVLILADRGHSSNDTRAALALLKEYEFKTGVQVMVGLPGDTKHRAVQTAQELAALRPDLARVYPLLVLAGSRLAHWYRSGKYRPLSLDQAVDQAKEMVTIFTRAGVTVTRIGLQATDMMEDSSQMIAGPWHPAFGHLVLSSLMLDRAKEAVDAALDHEGNIRKGPRPGQPLSVELQVNPKSLSRLQGNRKTNLARLAEQYPGVVLTIKQNVALAVGQVQACVRLSSSSTKGFV